jgi:hypothetical protein
LVLKSIFSLLTVGAAKGTLTSFVLRTGGCLVLGQSIAEKNAKIGNMGQRAGGVGKEVLGEGKRIKDKG